MHITQDYLYFIQNPYTSYLVLKFGNALPSSYRISLFEHLLSNDRLVLKERQVK